MSASGDPRGGAPQNPKRPTPPPTSMLKRSGPGILVGGLAIGLTYAYYATRAPGKPGAPSVNPLRTPGVKNIENAYSNAGATTTHTPAYGGTKMGDRGSVHLKEGSASGLRHGDGPGITDEAVGADQRSGQPNKIGKAWNNMQHGNEGGK